MLRLIGEAMDKAITGGQETFWGALSSAGVAETPQMAYSFGNEFSEESEDDENEFDALGQGAYMEEHLADVEG